MADVDKFERFGGLTAFFATLAVGDRFALITPDHNEQKNHQYDKK
jgi:hypothetical protein